MCPIHSMVAFMSPPLEDCHYNPGGSCPGGWHQPALLRCEFAGLHGPSESRRAHRRCAATGTYVCGCYYQHYTSSANAIGQELSPNTPAAKLRKPCVLWPWKKGAERGAGGAQLSLRLWPCSPVADGGTCGSGLGAQGCPTPPAAGRHTPGTGLLAALCTMLWATCAPARAACVPVWAACAPASPCVIVPLCLASRHAASHRSGLPRTRAPPQPRTWGCCYVCVTQGLCSQSLALHPCPLPHTGGTPGRTGGVRKPLVVCPGSHGAGAGVDGPCGRSPRAAGSSPAHL